MTHAAQQIVRGALPDEGSAGGRALEAHAQQVEQYVRGDGGAAKPSPELLHARPPGTESGEAEVVASTRQMMRELVDSGLARPDGSGGIVFTLPPSSMTGSAGTQRLATSAPAAQPGAAARHENWSGLETFGNTLAQGLGSDLLGMAGSAFGFSDEFMGEQRTALATQNREFERDQTKQAYTELRMEHLRTAALRDRNADETLLDEERTQPLSTEAVRRIEDQVDTEVTHRMQVLQSQTVLALQQLNEARATRRETALEEVPDESYDAAFHQLFDHPEIETLPTDEQLLTALTRAPATAADQEHGPGGPRQSTGGPGPWGHADAAATAAHRGRPARHPDRDRTGTGRRHRIGRHTAPRHRHTRHTTWNGHTARHRHGHRCCSPGRAMAHGRHHGRPLRGSRQCPRR